MLTRRRTSILIALTCAVTAALYAGLAEPFGYRVEWAGATLLLALGAAVGIMVYVLTSGSSD